MPPLVDHLNKHQCSLLLMKQPLYMSSLAYSHQAFPNLMPRHSLQSLQSKAEQRRHQISLKQCNCQINLIVRKAQSRSLLLQLPLASLTRSCF